MFWITLILIALTTSSISLVSNKLLPGKRSNPWLPVLAGSLFVIAFFIPDIHISKETTTFQQHFVGGGIYCTVLYIYFQKLFGWKTDWKLSLLFLFAFTSALGVANEMLEFTLTKAQIVGIDNTDTDWDLLANTLGSLSSFIVYLIAKRINAKN